jgi:hypothetical protein
MVLPYDLPSSHHQLLFTVLILFHKYENIFLKSKQNDIFT